MVDLHGLHVEEALEYAEQTFQSATLRNDKVVRFIVGTPFFSSSRRGLSGVCRSEKRLPDDGFSSDLQARVYMRRMASRKYGQLWKIFVKRTLATSHSSVFSPWSIFFRRGFTHHLDPKNAGVLVVQCRRG